MVEFDASSYNAYTGMLVRDNEGLLHYGILRRSGRYPWGSGGNAEQRSRSFLKMVQDLLDRGFREPEVAEALKIGRLDKDGNLIQRSTTDLRDLKTIAKGQIKAAEISRARSLKEERGMSVSAIGREMGKNESSVRALLREAAAPKMDAINTIANVLRNEISEKGSLDVGAGVNLHMGVSEQYLKTAITMLREEGYELINVQIPQLGSNTNTKTTSKVLAPEGTTYAQLNANQDKIGTIGQSSNDGGRSFLGIRKPETLKSSRLAVNYAENGGEAADGTMWIRRGADDLNLGHSSYAQVRINVDDTHYLKGMAVYRDDIDFPPGVDVIFNTNKSAASGKMGVLKPMKKLPKFNEDGTPTRDADGKIVESTNVDWDNPFGSAIKANNGQRGVFNIVNEEGDWGNWSKSLSSQVLSKQPNSLAKAQLESKQKDRRQELDEILALTNPVVKKRLLMEFADSADSSAVHLDAAGMAGQKTQVLIPLNNMKDNEIYAPNFNSGDSVALIRYPHGGKFEIPVLTVNNNSRIAKGVLGNARDAVGISGKVAQQLSGADFDGDTVLVIPNNAGKIRSENPLPGLKNYDAKASYPAYEGMKVISSRDMQMEMGKVSNLITDMTIAGAPNTDIEKAVRHSMVVIDAEKHKLNYKQSEADHDIIYLKKKYQGVNSKGQAAGASTIVSRASSTAYVNDYKPRKQSEGGPWDPKTGKLVKVPTGETLSDGSPKKTRSTKMAETDDAFTLTSGGSKATPGHAIEKIYAEHANGMKELANEARRQYSATKTAKRNPSAAKAYEAEVSTLKAKLNIALRNAPLERKAQLLGNAIYTQKKQANPEMSHEETKKIKGMALAEARLRTGASKTRVEITPKEWEAIQANAVSPSLLDKILANSDTDTVRTYATPRERTVMTDGKIARAKAMLSTGNYTQAEIARAIGVPVSTLNDSL